MNKILSSILSVKARTITLVATTAGVVLPVVASAVTVETADTSLGEGSLTETFGGIIDAVLAFLGVLALGIFIYAGFKWMTAGGNEDAVGEAKKMITASIIGMVIIFISYSASSYIIEVLNNQTGADLELE